MKRISTSAAAVLLGLVVFFIGSTSYAQCECDYQMAKALGRVYILSAPFTGNIDQLMQLMEEYPSLFEEHGRLIVCARQIGQRLVHRGLSSYSQADYDRAYKSVLSNGGSLEAAQEIARKMNGTSVDMFAIGNELVWLADVLPDAASGDWSSFYHTGTEVRQWLRVWGPVILAGLDPAIRAIFYEKLSQYGPDAERYVFLILLMSCH